MYGSCITDLGNGSYDVRGCERKYSPIRYSGPAAVWLRLLSGDLEPGAALMGGGLKLTRGSFFSLLPHLRAAQALLECARLVPTHMPAAGI